MHLTDPVECYGCHAVSVNGGIQYCAACVAALHAEIAELRESGCACGHHAPHNVQGEGNIRMFFCSVPGCSCRAPRRESRAMLDLVWCNNRIATLTSDRAATDQFFRDVLVLLAKAGIPTPERGYANDGGFALVLSDLDRLVKERDEATEQNACLTPRYQEAMDMLAALEDPHEICDDMGRRTVRMFYDDPAMDGSDAAHPAWWRGNEVGVLTVVRIVNALLDREPHRGTFGCSELEQMAQRIVSLTKENERLRAIRNPPTGTGGAW